MDDERAYPLPQPGLFTAPFWEACQREALEVSVCKSCDHLFLPGGPVCPRCWSDDLRTRCVSGHGEVYSYAIYRRTYHPAIPAPYVVAIIELDEGVRMVSNVISCVPEAVNIGMRVQVVFTQEAGFTLPRFQPVSTSSTASNSPSTKEQGENNV